MNYLTMILFSVPNQLKSLQIGLGSFKEWEKLCSVVSFTPIAAMLAFS